MDFDLFKHVLPKIGKMYLPGHELQGQMVPEIRKKFLENPIPDNQPAKWAAVICLFYPDPLGKTHFVMIRRSDDRGVHARQIAFPGGSVAPHDVDLKATALRECEEEVGIERTQIEVVCALSQVYIPPSHYWVQPYIAYMNTEPKFTPQTLEVDEILQVPLHEFLQEDIISQQLIKTSYAGNIEVPTFRLQGHLVWGATAMMLSEVRFMIKNNI